MNKKTAVKHNKSFLLFLLCFLFVYLFRTGASPLAADSSFEGVVQGHQVVSTGYTTGSAENISGDDAAPAKATAEDAVPTSLGLTNTPKLPVLTTLGGKNAADRETIIVDTDDEIVVEETEGTAIGIDARNGAVDVINYGSITARMRASERGDAIGVVTGNANDSVTNHGDIIADSEADETSPPGEAGRAETSATGVSTGGGDDVALNEGSLTATATAEAGAGEITINLAGESKINTPSTAQAAAIGIEGGQGDDEIVNEDYIEVLATSESKAAGVDLTIDGDVQGDVSGGALSDSSATADAMAIGIEGGSGIDEITNRGAIVGNVDSSATAVGVGVDIAITEEGNASGAALSDASVKANAAAIGIDGGGDGDTVDNQGDIELLSNSDATGVAVSLDVAGTMKGDAEGSSVSDASVTAASTATGIEGGEGDDTIDNEGMISLMNGVGDDETDASATAASVALTVSGTMEGNVAGEALSDSSATADAVAIGIDGGAGMDEITNRAHVTADVDSTATGVSVSVPITITGEGNAVGSAVSDASVTANTSATGIDGGDGDDTIVNGEEDAVNGAGDIELYSTSEATGVAVSVTLAGSMEGDTEGTALSDSSTTANATATGIDGGAGMDEITNRAHVTADVDSTATGVSVSVPITITGEGSAVGSAVSDASVTAKASAMGIDGGDDDDTIVNAGAITLMEGYDTDASATGVAVGLSVSGKISLSKDEEAPESAESEDGNDTISGKAVSDASATANAEATGIDGGGGVDDISNTANILADVGADATSVSVSLGIAGSVTTNSDAEVDITGEALSDASAKANAAATGIAGGMGGDTVDNQGHLDLSSESEATGVAVGVDISGKVGLNKGEDDEEPPESEDGETDDKSTVSGKALSDASATANAEATGIDGGAGVDDITNSSAIVADAISDADAVSVSLGVAVDVTTNSDSEVDITGEALSDARATANAAATGIAGGDDDDTIVNTGTITLMERNDTDASAVGVAVGLNISGKVSLNKSKEDGEAPEAVVSEDDESDAKDTISGKAVSSSGATANAEATGIDGGGGVDDITNTADILADVGADATAVSVSLGVAGSVTTNSDSEVDITGAALSDASATANAAATGIDGDAGGDTIGNQGYIDLSSDSDATGVAASLSVAGAITSKGDTEAEVEGSAVSDTSVTANATATGIDGGAGVDTIHNETVDGVDNAGTIDLEAISDATGVSASLGVTTAVAINGDAKADVAGSTVSDASVTANALTTGIAGGGDDDGIDNEGYIDLYSDSSATGVAAGVSFTSVVSIKGNTDAEVTGEAVSDTTVDAHATAIGIDGGGGIDMIDNSGDIDLLATSDALGVAASLDVTGSLTFKGVAKSDVTGAAASKSSVTATAAATGIDGGDGDDGITNTGAITIMDGYDPDAVATAVAASLSVAVNAAIKGVSTGTVSGTALSEAITVVDATATGIDGGMGDDTIDNEGAINLLPNSDATSVAASLNVTVDMSGTAEGSALGDASVMANAAATGIDGGEGNDTITNEGAITLMKQGVGEDEEDATALGVAASLSISGNVVGTTEGKALSEASVTADAAAAGIDGGEGVDDITNTGQISADVDSHAEGVSVAADVTVTGDGKATGSALSEASVTANAAATGIDGGEGDDTIVNETDEEVDGSGEIELFATSDATATAVSVSIAGAMNGAAEGGALSKAGVVSDAAAIGIDGGGGVDTIENRSDISGDVSSTADAVSVSVGITVGVHGKADGEALSDASVTALGTAIGVNGGDGGDTIENEGLIDMEAISSASATTVSVQLSGSMGGVAKGKAMADGSAEAISHAAGIDGGDGDDEIDSSTNDIVTYAESTADSQSVSVSLAGSVGLTSGASIADASATGTAYATGIDGGPGHDTIENASDIEAVSNANAEATSTSVDVALGVGVVGSIGVGNSSATAVAESAGISGAERDVQSIATTDSAAGSSTLVDESLIPADAEAPADIVGKWVRVSEGDFGNFVTLVEAFDPETGEITLADALPSNLSQGDEYTLLGTGSAGITNSGMIEPGAEAHATAGSTTVSVGIGVGFSEGEASADASATAKAVATGIRGGSGADRIDNSGEISVGANPEGPKVLATAEGTSETVKVGLTLGANEGSASSNSSATAVTVASGIDTGLGDDWIENTKAIAVGTDGTDQYMAIATAASETIDVGVTLGMTVGEVSSDASATAKAVSTGIDSGSGDDWIDNGALIEVASSSQAFASGKTRSVKVTLGKSDGVSRSDAATLSQAFATGIDAGSGEDDITTESEMTVKAFSEAIATSSAKGVNALSIGSSSQSAAADSSATADAVARGIDGGAERDMIGVGGTLDVTAGALVGAVSRSAAVTGFALGSDLQQSEAQATTGATTLAVGIDGGEGDDDITNDAAMMVNAGSDVAVGCYSEATQGLNLVGESNAEATADASTSVATTGVGIAGGQGFDDIQTNGAISVTSASNAVVTSKSTVESNTFIGSASAKAASDASAQIAAYATGIDGGDGGGGITGNNAISAFATSYGKATSTSKATADVTFGSASTSTAAAAAGEATAVAAGIITDGIGDDVVGSLDAIDATAEATLNFTVSSVSVSETTFGDAYAASAADASALTSSKASGISVGDGTNVVENDGTLSASATSNATVSIRSVALCDSTFGDGYTVATSSVSAVGESVASGIEGGDGVDTMINTGSIAVAAGGNLTVNALTVSSDGPANADARTRAIAQAVGIDAAGGGDGIVNAGQVLVAAAPRIVAATRTFGTGGNVDGSVGVELTADAKGVATGGGDDTIINTGDILVLVGRQSESTVSAEAASGSTRFRTGEDPSELVGKWIAVRTSGDTEGSPDFFTKVEAYDEGTNEFVLRDPLTYDLQAGATFTIFDIEDGAFDINQTTLTAGGRTSVDASTMAAIHAIGIDGGDGYNAIASSGAVQVKASNRTRANEVTIGGGVTADVELESVVNAAGIAGGNTIMNLGPIGVEADSAVNASGWKFSWGGMTDVETGGFSQAVSTGCAGGELNDTLQNFGSIETSSDAHVLSTERVEAIFSFKTALDLSFEASGDSTGISAGAGDDMVFNYEDGLIDVDAVSGVDVAGVTTTLSYGTINFVDANAGATALGLDLGTGQNTAYNEGELLVSADADATAIALSNFGLYQETAADADAFATATAKGITAGNDDDHAFNYGLVDVEADAKATSTAEGSKVGGDDESTVTEDSDAGDATFTDESRIDEDPGDIIGKWILFTTGDSEGFITRVIGFDPDEGTFALLSPIPNGDGGLSAGDVYVLGGAGTGDSVAVAQAIAVGIDLQGGNNDTVAENEGKVDVWASAEADTSAVSYAGQSTAAAEATAQAKGIATGDGNDTIRNAGIIIVRSEVATTASGASVTETSKAWGIITGDGNDTVVNSGSIVTEIVLNGADPLAGVGILAGAGNDIVVLGDGSSVTGDVDLGADDDTLYLIGSPVVNGALLPDGAESLDSGIDSLIFEGAGSFVNPLDGFNRATKQGLGVYTVEDGLPPMQRLEVKEGTLQLGTLENKKDYQFSETGTFLTQVNSDGSHGKLHVTGTAQLGGGLTVFRGPEGAYVNGTKYDIIEATGAQDGLTGAFSDVLLPMPTTLLSFDVNQLPNLVEVEVLAKSFTTVATDRVELAIGRYLDRIIRTATGDLSNVIGEFQMLSMPEFDAAFASLSPGQYDSSTRTTYDVTQQYTNTLLKRMHSVQLTGTSASTIPQIIAVSGKETKFLAYDGSDASIWQLYKSSQQKEATYGVWLDGFGQSGDQEEGDGFTGYDYNLYGVSLGFDRIFCNKYIAGIGIGYSDTDIDLDRNEGDGDIEGIYGSLYGSYYTERGYIDAVLSYGSQDYDNERPIVIGSIGRRARSDHDGDAYSAFVEGGYNIALDQWVFQPFASLHYIYLDEDGFRETGADSLNQIVDDRQTESLVSELGLRVAHVFELNRGALIPEMSLAWNYDFDIDDRTITTSFAGAPDTAFSIEGQDVTEHGVTVGAGVTLMNKGRFSTSLKYNGEFREDYQAHGVIGELRYEF